jgi:DNA-binding beta-propeller fold protein YncE
VWVADNLRGRLLQIDPQARTHAGSADAGKGPVAVAVGSGTVWVASADGTVRRFDSATGTATGPPESVPGASGVAVGEGSVWVTSQTEGTVTRLDPASGRRDGEPIKVGSQPTDIAVGSGSVWVANSQQYGATVSQIDPDTGKAAAPIEVATGQVYALTYGEGGVWVAASDEIRGDEIKIIRIDPESAEPEGDFVPLARPGLPVRLAAGAGSVWVAQAGSATGGPALEADAGEVSRLDPERRSRIGAATPLPGAPTGISVGEGSVWITIGGAGAVTSVARIEDL